MGTRFNQSAYHRTQATFLTYDIIDRMRANLAGVRQGKYDLIATGTLPDELKCLSTSCSPADFADVDIRQWGLQLQSLLPSGAGSIKKSAGDSLFLIQVMWDDREPTSGTPCDSTRPSLQCVSISVRL